MVPLQKARAPAWRAPCLVFRFLLQFPGPFLHGFQILSREGVGVFRHLFRGAGCHNAAAASAAFRSQVNDIVGALDHIQIVLNNDHRIARVHQFVQHLDKTVHIGHMQTGGGFVQNIHGLPGSAACQFVGQLHPLGFTARQRCRSLPQLNIAKADLLQRLQLAGDFGDVGEEVAGFLHRHIQHIGDVLVLVLDFQRFPVVPLALTDITGHVDIRQEMHLDLQDTAALAGFTAAALDVEAEPSRAVPAHLGILRAGKQRADISKHAGIGGGVGARRAPDGRLINTDDLVHPFHALHFLALSGTAAGTVQGCRQRLVEDLIHQCGFAGAGYTGHADHFPQREVYRDILQVILMGFDYPEVLAVALPTGFRHFHVLAPRKIGAGNAPLHLADIGHTTRCHDLTAVDTGTRSHIHNVVRLPHGVFIMLHHDQGIAQIAQAFHRGDQLVVVALVQTDAGLIQHIQHAR